eukprot:TRINITY_DN2387_c0_g1_i2.p1 TRINITY_DN2387_c0_g1~~TRINITY_DN2387_c0_g1_i2.p1  ORF type:complete len:153 (+),score=18.24 TRINITY_DN2387_c0_g1_i2:107-565(+)
MLNYLPPSYPWTIVVFATSWFVNILLSIQVSRARKKYNVRYPKLYADGSKIEAEAFNCVQRAHQNFLEQWIPVMMLMFIAAAEYTFWATVCGFIWCAGRVVYGIGYARFGPKGRMLGGIISHFGDFPLLVMCIRMSYAFLGTWFASGAAARW